MTIVSNNVVAMATLGNLVGISVPSAPTLASSVSGQTATITLAGVTGATHYLRYKKSTASSWTDGGSRSGDGNIEIASLEYDVVYIITAYSAINGVISTPTPAIAITISETQEGLLNPELEDTADEFLTAFGETITYNPSGGGSRSILAIIDQLEPGQLTNNSNAQMTTISVANNSTSGISAAEIDTGGDKVTLAIRRGETAMQRRITSIISQDAGMMTLEVR